MSEHLTIDRRTVYSYDLTDGSKPFFDLDAMGVREEPVLGNGQSIILDLSRTHTFDPNSPIGVVLSFANHSLYYMAMWKKDTHIGMIEEGNDVEKYIIDNGMVDDFNRFLRDTCSVNITLGHDSDGLTVVREKGSIPFRTGVSRGVMILSRLYVWLRRCSDRDALIFFDDFDDMFHYRTAENAIRAIISRIRAQCIFVTHNTGLISNDFLRPDCCFIMNDGNLSSFASLTDKDIRKGHNLEKMLREGEFDRTGDQRSLYSASSMYMHPSSPMSGLLRKSEPLDEGNPISTPFPQPPEASSRRAMSPGANR